MVASDSAVQAVGAATEASVDVLLTDMVLPDGTGSDLARTIQEANPRIRVVFMSAHPVELLLEQGRLEPGEPYLQKPFEMEDLHVLLETIVR